MEVVVKMTRPDLFMIVGIDNELEEKLNRPVDIVTYRENMNQVLKKTDRRGGGMCVTRNLSLMSCAR